MGYYIEVPERFGKAQQIIDKFGAEEVSEPEDFGDIPEGKALVVVVANPNFEAAGFAYDDREFAAFTSPTDHRPKRFLLLDWDVAVRESGIPATAVQV